MTFAELVKEYVNRFDESVPMYFLSGCSEDEIISMLEKALQDGKPIEADYIEGVDY